MKFENIPYQRIDFASIKKKLASLEKQYRNAKTYPEAKKAEEAFMDLLACEVVDPINYIQIKNSIDTSDSFYETELKYNNRSIAKLLFVMKAYYKDLANTPFFEEYKKEGKENAIQIAKASLKTNSIKTIFINLKKSNLRMEYSKLVAQAKTNFQGEELNFYGLLKKMQDPNRELRKAALKSWSDLYESISVKLDPIYDQLVRLMEKESKLLHYSSVPEMVYESRNIFDYDSEDIKRFKGYIVKYIVPACQKLREEQRKRLGVEHLYYYDEAMFYPTGALVPEGSSEQLVEKALTMYQGLSKESGEYFNFIKENHYFDLETKPNKAGGGYCSALPKYKAPFIFSNFNGTSADVDVLTHEAGHGFAAYTSFHGKKDIYAENNMTMDIAEIHSMSMELFTYPYMELFFGGKANEYRLLHSEEALMAIPYLCAVDEFQHRVFANPKASYKQRRAIWKAIEEEYLPWRDYGELPFLKEGGFWMQKQHIFLYPFYYIDYALSQLCAFQFYQKDLQDHEKAWKDYYKLCQIAGQQGYLATLKEVGLKSPLEESTVKGMCEFMLGQIEALKSKINEVTLK